MYTHTLNIQTNLGLAHIEHEGATILGPLSIAAVENVIHRCGRILRISELSNVHERRVWRHVPRKSADGDGGIAQPVLGAEGNTADQRDLIENTQIKTKLLHKITHG